MHLIAGLLIFSHSYALMLYVGVCVSCSMLFIYVLTIAHYLYWVGVCNVQTCMCIFWRQSPQAEVEALLWSFIEKNLVLCCSVAQQHLCETLYVGLVRAIFHLHCMLFRNGSLHTRDALIQLSSYNTCAERW